MYSEEDEVVVDVLHSSSHCTFVPLDVSGAHVSSSI